MGWVQVNRGLLFGRFRPWPTWPAAATWWPTPTRSTADTGAKIPQGYDVTIFHFERSLGWTKNLRARIGSNLSTASQFLPKTETSTDTFFWDDKKGFFKLCHFLFRFSSIALLSRPGRRWISSSKLVTSVWLSSSWFWLMILFQPGHDLIKIFSA